MTVEVKERNPFKGRDPFKKRVITVSVTADQQEAIDRLKGDLELKTDGALIKAAIALLWDQQYSGGHT